MSRHIFTCIDAHTCGNPVRVVTDGAPELDAGDASARRAQFAAEYDWIRTGLMFEPRGHDMMSGAILYPSTREDCDIGVVFIETSGCLPMCGHGTIGTVTVAIEHDLVEPREEGVLRLDTPAGPVEASYRRDGANVDAVRIRNVASYLALEDVRIEVAGIGALGVDIAYGGNFYAIVEPQANYADMDELSPLDIQRLSPLLRDAINAAVEVVHPEDLSISGVSHILWTGQPKSPGADARNAVFYGRKAIDRSPCGTGTSARMAQLTAKGALKVGDEFVHESIIGSLFRGRVEEGASIGNHSGIIPSVEGWARITGFNTIVIDERDPYAHGFEVL
ncbi:MAG: 4-hydroxyproline epimerase [Alphaproteobacteria bacterium]